PLDQARPPHPPHGRPRRATRRVRPGRVRPPGVQLLPQSPLPEVRGLARGALDRGAHGPPRAEPLLPRRLHPARHAPPAGPARPPTALHAAVPRRHADAPHRRPRSRPAGGTPRRDRRAAHLDPRPPVPSPPPLHRHGWGPRARPAAVDRHRPPPPLSGARPQPPLPRQVSRRPRPRVRRRPPRPRRRLHPARRPPRLRPLQGSALPPGLDRLRQAPLRGPAPALPLPPPLHASRRPLQSPPSRRHGHPSRHARDPSVPRDAAPLATTRRDTALRLPRPPGDLPFPPPPALPAPRASAHRHHRPSHPAATAHPAAATKRDRRFFPIAGCP